MKAKTDFETHWSWKKLTGRPESPNFTIEIPAMPTKEDIANLHKKINHDRKVLHSRIDGLARIVQGQDSNLLERVKKLEEYNENEGIEWDDTPTLDQFEELSERVKMLEDDNGDRAKAKIKYCKIINDIFDRVKILENKIACNNWIYGEVEEKPDNDHQIDLLQDKINWLIKEVEKLDRNAVGVYTLNNTIDWIVKRFEKIEKKFAKKPKKKTEKKIDIKEKFYKFLDKRNCRDLFEKAMEGIVMDTDPTHFIDLFIWADTNEGYSFWEGMNEEWLIELKKIEKKPKKS